MRLNRGPLGDEAEWMENELASTISSKYLSQATGEVTSSQAWKVYTCGMLFPLSPSLLGP